MTQYVYAYDSNRCVRCHACESACKMENQVHVGHSKGSGIEPVKVDFKDLKELEKKGPRYRRVRTLGDGPGTYFLSMSCNHCSDPICWKACPLKGKDLFDHKGAIYKEKTVGAVIIQNGKLGTPKICDPEKAKCGGVCKQACPYDAPQWNPVSKVMEKCHLCVLTRLKRPDPDGVKRPACVDVCLGRALQITDDPSKPYNLVRNSKGRYKGKEADTSDGGATKFVEIKQGIPPDEQHADEFTRDLTKAGAASPDITKPNTIVRPKLI